MVQRAAAARSFLHNAQFCGEIALLTGDVFAAFNDEETKQAIEKLVARERAGPPMARRVSSRQFGHVITEGEESEAAELSLADDGSLPSVDGGTFPLADDGSLPLVDDGSLPLMDDDSLTRCR